LRQAIRGFYPIEQYQGHRFRWSDTAAAIQISVSAGTRQIRINCLPVRDLTDPACDLRFYLDGARIPPGQLTMEEQRVSIDLHGAAPGVLTLGWTCVPLPRLRIPAVWGWPSRASSWPEGRSAKAIFQARTVCVSVRRTP
jgi:hypothetical protein